MNLNLRPLPRLEKGLPRYLAENFRTLQDELARVELTAHGVAVVTGTLDISTGLTIVEDVVVSFYSDPVSGCAFVSGFPVGAGAPGDITIKTFTSAFAASTTAKSISWLAIGS